MTIVGTRSLFHRCNICELLAGLLFFLALTGEASARQSGTPTRIVVRAVANDAKLIGSGVGGAHIIIKNSLTGDVLAEGVQKGSTGDTQKIIVQPRPRHGQIFDTDGSAQFETTLNLREPTMVDITAFGPLGTPESTVSSTKKMLLVPGRNIAGEGVIIELNGFTVEWLGGDFRTDITATSRIPVAVKVTMLCGCPTKPGGLWDSGDIDVIARITQRHRPVQEVSLNYSGSPSIYEGSLSAPTSGNYMIEILAMDDAHGNYGRLRRSIAVVNRP